MKLKSNVAVSDSGFVFNPSTGDSFSVNPVGQEIINLIKDGKSQKQIIQQINAEYFIDEGTIEKDLDDFKKLLATYKLIENPDE